MFPTEFAISVLIDSMGEDVSIIKRTETVDDDTGEVTFTYTRTIDTHAFIREISGYVELWELIGYRKDIDLSGVFYYNENVDVGDIIKRENGNEFEVTEVVDRTSGKDIDYKEVLMKGIE